MIQFQINLIQVKIILNEKSLYLKTREPLEYKVVRLPLATTLFKTSDCGTKAFFEVDEETYVKKELHIFDNKELKVTIENF